MPNIPEIAQILKDPKSVPSIADDIEASRHLYSKFLENFNYGTIYPNHLVAFSEYLFSSMHPAVQTGWVSYILADTFVQYINLLNEQGRLMSNNSRLAFAVVQIPKKYHHLIPKPVLAKWLASPDRTIRIMAQSCLSLPPDAKSDIDKTKGPGR